MASGGNYGRSVDQGSEAYYDFSCSACALDGRNVEAIKGCLQCRQNFCTKCLGDHNKFQGLKEHDILDKSQMVTSLNLQMQTWLPTEKCLHHHGKILDMFCGTHDVVCCGACIAIDHRHCKGVNYILNAAQAVDSSKEAKQVMEGLKNVTMKLKQIKSDRLAYLQRINDEKTANITNIDKFRDKVVQFFDTMVEKAKSEVCAKHTSIEKKINADISALSELTAALETNVKHIETSKMDNGTQAFFYVKQGKGMKADGNELLSKMKALVGKENIRFTIHSNIEEFIMKLKTIGEMEEIQLAEQKNTMECYATLQGEYNVKISTDTERCDIAGACLLDDDSVIITDYSNHKIKRLDKSYRVFDHYVLQGAPWGICKINQSEVAMAMNDNGGIVVVSTTGKLMVTRAFTVDGLCRDVISNKGKLFVSFYSRMAPIGIYSPTGTYTHNFLKDSPEQPINRFPGEIISSRNGNTVHVTNGNKVINIDRKGNLRSTFTDPDLENAWGICFIEDDELLVSDDQNHKIIHLDKHGRKIQVLLSQKDGLTHPQALTYDAVKARLIVSMRENDHIKVFNITRKQ